MSGFVATVDALATSNSGFKCNGEVGGDGEGDLLSEWYFDLDLLAIHSSGPPSSTKYVEGLENRVYNKGDTRPVQTLVGSSLSVWYSGSDWGYGTSFPIQCVCVRKMGISVLNGIILF